MNSSHGKVSCKLSQNNSVDKENIDGVSINEDMTIPTTTAENRYSLRCLDSLFITDTTSMYLMENSALIPSNDV